MSLWQFNFTFEGWREFHCASSDDEDRKKPASKAELMELFGSKQGHSERLTYQPLAKPE